MIWGWGAAREGLQACKGCRERADGGVHVGLHACSGSSGALGVQRVSSSAVGVQMGTHACGGSWRGGCSPMGVRVGLGTALPG